jgi:phospholipase C
MFVWFAPRCFHPDDLPVSTALALEYGLIDRWFCSVPGPTMPNRYYLMAATSAGVADNSVGPILRGFSERSIFGSMEASGYRWASYFGELPTPLAYKDTRRFDGNFHHFSTFADDARAGRLPELTLIDPRYFSTPQFPANDDHPDHQVRAPLTVWLCMCVYMRDRERQRQRESPYMPC